MTDTIEVYVDHNGETCRVGSCRFVSGRHRRSSVFDYADAWLDRTDAFALDPANLPLEEPRIYTTSDRSALPGPLRDTAPDRWGQQLVRRAFRKAGEQRPLSEIDYLLAITDQTRIGALRYRREGEEAFDHDIGRYRVPPLIQLPALINAADAVQTNTETTEDLRLLLNEGSPLGGARPKSAVVDDRGRLAIAKFPKNDDDRSIPHGEVLAMTLAANAGVNVAEARLQDVAGRPVSLVTRFDRDGGQRIPFLSAMSLLGLDDGDDATYTDIAEPSLPISVIHPQPYKITEEGGGGAGALRAAWRADRRGGSAPSASRGAPTSAPARSEPILQVEADAPEAGVVRRHPIVNGVTAVDAGLVAAELILGHRLALELAEVGPAKLHAYRDRFAEPVVHADEQLVADRVIVALPDGAVVKCCAMRANSGADVRDSGRRRQREVVVHVHKGAVRLPVVDAAARQLDLLLPLVRGHVVENVQVCRVVVDRGPVQVLSFEPDGPPVVPQRDAAPDDAAPAERVCPCRERRGRVHSPAATSTPRGLMIRSHLVLQSLSDPCTASGGPTVAPGPAWM